MVFLHFHCYASDVGVYRGNVDIRGEVSGGYNLAKYFGYNLVRHAISFSLSKPLNKGII